MPIFRISLHYSQSHSPYFSSLLMVLKFVDVFARSYTENPILVALIFFGIILIGSDLLTTPFSYYKTFVIEGNFGFKQIDKSLVLEG